jgi:hypothetical protein
MGFLTKHLFVCRVLTIGRPFVPNIDQPTPADNQNEPYVPYYRYLLSQPTKSLPQVISNSYGDEEDVSSSDANDPGRC